MFIGIAAGVLTGVLSSLSMAAIWPAQVVRIAVRNVRRVNSRPLALAYAFFVMTAYFPQMVGQAKYFTDRLRRRANRLIEYKNPHRSQ